MKIIVVGLGRTGTFVVSSLSQEKYDITVIDKDPILVNSITDKYNVNGVSGSGASKDTLLRAGADTADALIALTRIDEINLISCMQAKVLGTKKTAARIVEKDLVDEACELKKQYNIDYIVKPKYDVAEEICKNIGLPGFVKIEGCYGKDLQILEMNILENSPLKNKSLMDIKKNTNLNLLVSSVIRGGKLYIPGGDFVLKSGDTINIVAVSKDIKYSLRAVGISSYNFRNITIVGGGTTSDYLVSFLEKKDAKITVIETNLAKCRSFAKKFPNTNVVYADGEIVDVLESENTIKSDVLVSVTDSDEANLVTSMYGWSKGIPSVITRVSNPEHAKLLKNVNIDITVSPTVLSTTKILRFVRNIETVSSGIKFYNVAGGLAEIMDFIADDKFELANIPFMNKSFKIKKDVLVVAIERDGEVFIPQGSSVIKPGDRVIITAPKKSKIRSLDDIIR